MLPDLFLWIELGSIGWEMENGDIRREYGFFFVMPSHLVFNNHRMGVFVLKFPEGAKLILCDSPQEALRQRIVFVRDRPLRRCIDRETVAAELREVGFP